MAVQRVNVAQNLPSIFKLVGVEHLAAHHERQSAAGVHHVASDAAIQVLVLRDGGQHFAGQLVGHVAREHFGADFFQLHINAFERVGRVFGIRIKELEQHFFGIFNQPWGAPCPHAQETKHGHVFVVD